MHQDLLIENEIFSIGPYFIQKYRRIIVGRGGILIVRTEDCIADEIFVCDGGMVQVDPTLNPRAYLPPL